MEREGEGEGGREGGREGGWWWWEGLLPVMVVAPNRWSANGQETLSTVLYLQRERERERERERMRERMRERERYVGRE